MFPDAPPLLARLGQALNELGKMDAAIDAYGKAFRGDFQSKVYFPEYVSLLVKAEKLPDALAAVERYRTRNNELSILVTHAELLSQFKRHDEGITLLTQRQKEMGFNVDLVSALAEQYDDAEKFTEGLETAKKLIEMGFDSAYAHFLVARAGGTEMVSRRQGLAGDCAPQGSKLPAPSNCCDMSRGCSARLIPPRCASRSSRSRFRRPC